MLIVLFLLIILSSIDTFIAGISLGISNIRLKLNKIMLINTIITISLILTFYLRKIINMLININILKTVIIFLFLYLGIKKLYLYLKNNKLDLYTYSNKIDIDNNKILSLKEIIILVISLSLDNILICFSNNLIINNFIYFIVLHFIIGNILFFLANTFSYRLININTNINNLISGILYIILAIINIV